MVSSRLTHCASRKGFALVLVLGIMVLLAILAAGIAFSVRSEINVAGEFTDRVRARYLAYAGLQRALSELSLDNPGVDGYAETWSELRSDEEGWEFEDGVFVVRVTDETGKLNINTADRDTLVAFFTQITGDSAQAEEIADAVIDWRDADDEPELLGAESDYYLNLEQPYRAKNAPFDSPFELLLVRGITKDIFYGDADLGVPPLTELVTVYSASPNIDERGLPRVNINTATREQLLEALGDILTEQEIDAILRYRDGTQQQQGQQTRQLSPPAGEQAGSIQLPSSPGTGQQQRRQIRSPLDLRRVLPTEKLIAIWERITTTDSPTLYGLVNINTAPPEVLSALLPDNPAAVEEILAYREQNGSFVSVGELLNLASLTQAELQRLVSSVCVKSGTFRIRAAGIIGNRRVVHLIDTIVERQVVQSTGSSDALTVSDQPTLTVQFVVRSWKER